MEASPLLEVSLLIIRVNSFLNLFPCRADLSSLSYIAGTLVGNPSIRVFDGPAAFGAREIVSSRKALAAHNIEPIPLQSKEHLGILNGTAFSASVAALALNDAVHLALLAQVCTAMGTEALNGTRSSYDRFIHAVARPHPGQVSITRSHGPSDILMMRSCARLNLPRFCGTFWKVVSLPKLTKRKCQLKTTKGPSARTVIHYARLLSSLGLKSKTSSPLLLQLR